MATIPGQGDQGGTGTGGGAGPAGRDGVAERKHAVAVETTNEVTADVFAPLSFDTVLFDDADMFSASAEQYITASHAGPYFVCAQVRWDTTPNEVQSRIVVTDIEGNPVEVDIDTRSGTAAMNHQFVVARLQQGQRVALEVRSDDEVDVTYAKLSMLGGTGQKLFWHAITYFDAELATGLEGEYEIVAGVGTKVTEDAPAGVNADLSPSAKPECGGFDYPPYPYDEEEVKRPAIKLKKNEDPDVYSVTWAARTNDECEPVSIDFRASSVAARGIASIEDSNTSFGTIFMTAGADQLLIEWKAGEVSLLKTVDGVLETFDSFESGDPGLMEVGYSFVLDLVAGTWRTSIEGDVHEGALPEEVRNVFDGGTLGRGGMFSRGGDTILIPGPHARLGAVVVQMIVGEAHIEPEQTGRNAAVQAVWEPLLIPAAGDYSVVVEGAVDPVNAGRQLLVRAIASRGGIRVLGQLVGTSLVEQQGSMVEIDGDGEWELELGPFNFLQEFDVVAIRIDDYNEGADPCDPVLLTSLGYRL